MSAATDDDQWDFYPCKVDDAPASIFLNLAYAKRAPLPEATHLLWIGLQLLHPGDHGMGVDPDASALHKIEDHITAAAEARGMHYVGRLRNDGDWQLNFYGRPEHEAQLDKLAMAALSGTPRRGYRTGGQPDPTWSYYTDFLYPDRERLLWMMDRQVVSQLIDRGDVPERPRPVDHYLYFPLDADVTGFCAAAEQQNFKVATEERDNQQTMVHLQREDSLEDLRIHDVVMELVALGEAHGGDYDGWGAPVAR